MATKQEKKERKLQAATLGLLILGFILWLINLTFTIDPTDNTVWGKTKQYIAKTIHVATILVLAILVFFVATLFGLAWLGWLFIALAVLWSILYFTNNLPWQSDIKINDPE